jgi:putative ABC transport system permease protein
LAIVFVETFPRAVRIPVNTVSVLGLLLGAALLVSPVLALLASTLRRILIPIFGPAGWIGSINIVRARSRSALTVATLMIGLTMVIAFGQEVNSVRADVLSWVDTALGGDIYIRAINPMRPGFGDELLQTPGVQAVTPTTFTETSLLMPAGDGEPSPVNVRAIDPETYLQVGTFKFDEPPPDPAARIAELAKGNALFIATTLADRYGIERGEQVAIETDDGPRRLRVAGIIVDFTAQGNAITIGRRDLERYFGLSRVHMFTLVAAPGVEVSALADDIRARYADSEHVAVHSRTMLKERINSLMDQQSALLYALVAIALVVAAVGIVNTLMMNVMERKQEIGMLLSLGMTQRQVVKVVLAESASMGLVGTLLGLGLGLVVSRALIKGANIVAGYRFAYTFSATPFLLAVAIGLLLSQLAGLYPARRAARTNIVEAIKQE